VAGIGYALLRLATPWSERKGLWKALWRVACPWWSSEGVTFFHTYVGDVLTSMVKIFLNMALGAYLVASGDLWLPAGTYTLSPTTLRWEGSEFFRHVLSPSIVFLPLWWRFVQCLIRYKVSRSVDECCRLSHLSVVVVVVVPATDDVVVPANVV
jgi:hypothetical protein